MTSYTKLIECNNPRVLKDYFDGKNITLLFDSSFDVNTSSELFEVLMSTYLLPKVCFSIVRSYMPSVIRVNLTYSTSNYTIIHINLANKTYEFGIHYAQMYGVYYKNIYAKGMHEYIIPGALIDYYSFFHDITTCIPYTNDWDALRVNIHKQRCTDNRAIICNINIFLQIMDTILMTTNMIISYKLYYDTNSSAWYNILQHILPRE